MSGAPEHVGRVAPLRCGEIVLDLCRRAVLRSGQTREVEPKILEFLLYLVTHRTRIVTKAELLEVVWRGREVTDTVMTRAAHAARTLIGSRDAIRTVYGRGYQLSAEVTEEAPARDARPASRSPSVVRIGDLELDPHAMQLQVGGRPVPVQPKPFALLLHLCTNSHRTVSKEELRAVVWTGVTVTDAALRQSLLKVRRAIAGAMGVRLTTRRGYGSRLAPAATGVATHGQSGDGAVHSVSIPSLPVRALYL